MDTSTYTIFCEDKNASFPCRYCTDADTPSNGLSDATTATPTSNAPSRPVIDTTASEELNKTVKGLKIGHINTGEGGLMYHLDEIHCLLVEKSPDVLACWETWLRDEYDKVPIENRLIRLLLSSETIRLARRTRCWIFREENPRF